MKKFCCAIIDAGIIGTDLIYKLQRSPVLDPVGWSAQIRNPRVSFAFANWA